MHYPRDLHSSLHPSGLHAPGPGGGRRGQSLLGPGADRQRFVDHGARRRNVGFLHRPALPAEWVAHGGCPRLRWEPVLRDLHRTRHRGRKLSTFGRPGPGDCGVALLASV